MPKKTTKTNGKKKIKKAQQIKKIEKQAKKIIDETTHKSTDLDRVKTGITGLDELLYGGIPKGNLVVLSGNPGSGKSILCLQFINSGIINNKEKAVFISLEDEKEQIIKTAAQFGWDFKKHIDEKNLVIETIELYDFEKLKNSVEDLCHRVGASRLVIDPGVIFRLYFERELDARKKILALSRMLRKINVTTIITNELSTEGPSSLFGLEEYVADGVILLYHTRLKNKFVRGIGVQKMRGTRISEKLYPLTISKKGITVYPQQELLQDIL